MTKGFNRRKFVVGCATVVAGSALAYGLQEWLLSGTPFADAEAARMVGARYAAQFPEGEAGLWRGQLPKTEADWVPRLQALRREDFEANRIVRVDGWWLAETELRLCVLLHEFG